MPRNKLVAVKTENPDPYQGVREKYNLNEQQERFCREYMIDHIGARAYIRAGYACDLDTAYVNACRLLANAKIQDYISELRGDYALKTEAARKEVIENLTIIANWSIDDFVEVFEQEFKETNVLTGDYLLDDETGKPIVIRENVVRIKATEQIPKHLRKAVQSIKQTRDGIEVKMSDRLKAKELLGKMCGWITDKAEIVDKRIDFTQWSKEDLDARIALEMKYA